MKTKSLVILTLLLAISMIIGFIAFVFTTGRVEILEEIDFNFTEGLDFYECNQNFKSGLITCNVTNGSIDTSDNFKVENPQDKLILKAKQGNLEQGDLIKLVKEGVNITFINQLSKLNDEAINNNLYKIKTQ